MATKITPLEPSRNGQSDAYTPGTTEGTEVDTSTGAYVDVGGEDASKLVLLVSSTDTASCYIEAGMYTAKGIGNLKISSTGELAYVAGPFETARFKDSDGYINIIGDTGSNSNCHIQAILLP